MPNGLSVNKKYIIAAIFFIVVGIALPFGLSLFFAKQTSTNMTINEPIQVPYLQSNGKDFELVFYGYVGCTTVCTPTLHNLNDLYNSPSFAQIQPHVGITFVNLMPEITPDQPDIFAKSFNPNFTGIYLNQKQVMSIDREFRLFFSKRLMSPDEMDHNDYLYLVQRMKDGTFILKNIYTTHPLEHEMVLNDIRNYLKEMK